MSEFAKRAQVARSTITRACKPGGPLAPAVVRGRIQLDHDAVESWLVDHGMGLEVFDGQAPRPSAEIAGDLGSSAAEPLDQIESLSLRQLTDRHGGAEPFYLWVRARKELAMARRAEEQLARLQGRLISRALVQQAIGSHLESLHRRLLTDATQYIAARLTGAKLAKEDAEKVVRGQIAHQLSAAVQQTSMALRADDPTAPLRDPTPPQEAST